MAMERTEPTGERRAACCVPSCRFHSLTMQSLDPACLADSAVADATAAALHAAQELAAPAWQSACAGLPQRLMQPAPGRASSAPEAMTPCEARRATQRADCWWPRSTSVLTRPYRSLEWRSLQLYTACQPPLGVASMLGVRFQRCAKNVRQTCAPARLSLGGLQALLEPTGAAAGCHRGSSGPGVLA